VAQGSVVRWNANGKTVGGTINVPAHGILRLTADF
jgi:hypothetical protein